jgi:hypothetical protein
VGPATCVCVKFCLCLNCGCTLHNLHHSFKLHETHCVLGSVLIVKMNACAWPNCSKIPNPKGLVCTCEVEYLRDLYLVWANIASFFQTYETHRVLIKVDKAKMIAYAVPNCLQIV